jgi:DUF1680 family protein
MKSRESKVNTARVDAPAVPGSYAELNRQSKDEDIVEVSMPMSFYTESINDDPDLVAVLYGRLVMAGLVLDDVAFKGDKHNAAS